VHRAIARIREVIVMVAPVLLQDPSVRAWLGGIEPAWTLLDQLSFDSLRHVPPLPSGRPIRLATDLSADELQQSAVASSTALLLRRAIAAPGLKLTATGNLARSVVAEMADRFVWPGFDKAEAFRFSKVVNEPDFLPLLFVRQLAEGAGLLRKSKGHLRASPRGRAVLDEPNLRSLQALLFHLTMWHFDLGQFGIGRHGRWPQEDVGLVLWSLSVAATDWQSPERLTRLCTIPIRSVLEPGWHSRSMAMEARILRTLHWFGLLDHRKEPIDGQRFGERHFYRKTALFDRFLSFDVRTEAQAAIRH
jgi:hypothetical protein